MITNSFSNVVALTFLMGTSLMAQKSESKEPNGLPLLPAVRCMVLPVYPKLCKSAHDSRLVLVHLRGVGDHLEVVNIQNGNKYFNEEISKALIEWRLSSAQANETREFNVRFDFRMSDEVRPEGKIEILMDSSTIVVWGKASYTDTETLPVGTIPKGSQ